jgi:PAS domain S-box-containing protein
MHRIRAFLEQARSYRFVQHEREFQRREQTLLALLIKLSGCFVVAHAALHMIAINPAAGLIPLTICAVPLGCAVVAFRAQKYEYATEALVLLSWLAFVSYSAFGTLPMDADDWIYLLVPLVIGVVLLSRRSLVSLAAANEALVLAVGVLALPGIPVESLFPMLLGVTFGSGLALMVKQYLHAVDNDRRVVMAENESIFHTLITNLPVFLVVLDREGMITLVEGQALDSVPFNVSEFIGRSVYEAYKDFPQIVDDCRRALNGEVLNSTVTLGTMVLDVWYSPLVIDQGERNGMVAVATDVTERYRAEEVLQEQASLLQSVSDAIISVDLDFVIQTWNRAAEVIYGWMSYEVIGRPLHSMIPATQPAEWERDALAHVTNEGEWECELEQARKDGQTLCVLASFTRLEDEGGQIKQIIIVARDITERKRSEQQSLDLALEREKVKLLREFIGDSSHDFRTPLTTIRTSAYLLRVKHPEITTKHLDAIDGEVGHLERLLDDLLTLARLDRSPAFEFEPVDIVSLIDRIIVPLQLLAGDKQQVLSVQHDQQSLKTSADSMELERVFVNVLTNAISYTGEGESITVRTSAEQGWAVIQISDNGIGISETDLPHVFERFFRVDKTRSTRTGGTGLGLPIAKKIIEAHHGTIRAESVFGQGSTFVIRLPLIT